MRKLNCFASNIFFLVNIENEKVDFHHDLPAAWLVSSVRLRQRKWDGGAEFL
jgi:hypothetical protein